MAGNGTDDRGSSGSVRTTDPQDGPLHILVVEDNPGDVYLIREALEESDVESSVTVVTDGKKALDYLYQRNGYESATPPDLALIDLNVPKVDGRTVLERIRDDPELSSVPAAVLTSSDAPDDVRETFELGADAYFIKPVDPTEFLSTVRRIERSLVDSGELPSGEYADVGRDR